MDIYFHTVLWVFLPLCSLLTLCVFKLPFKIFSSGDIYLDISLSHVSCCLYRLFILITIHPWDTKLAKVEKAPPVQYIVTFSLIIHLFFQHSIFPEHYPVMMLGIGGMSGKQSCCPLPWKVNSSVDDPFWYSSMNLRRSTEFLTDRFLWVPVL